MSGLSWLLVLYSALRGFSPGSLVFPSSQKSTFPKFQFDRMQDLPGKHFRVSGASWVNIANYYYYYWPHFGLNTLLNFAHGSKVRKAY